MWRAYDLGYFVAGLNSRSVVAGELSAIARVLIDNGGRLKFNLEGLTADKRSITTAELETVLSDRNFESNTDFFVGRRQVTGPAPVEETELAGKLVHHTGKLKEIIDVIRIACANAESELAAIVAAHMRRPREAKSSSPTSSPRRGRWQSPNTRSSCASRRRQTDLSSTRFSICSSISTGEA